MKKSFTITLIISLIFLIPIFTILVLSGYNQKQFDLQQREEIGKTLLSLYSTEDGRIVNDIKQNIDIISKNPYITNGTQQECNDILAKLLSQNTYYSNIIFIKPDGSIYCGGILNNVENINEKGQNFFEKAIASNGFAIGNYQVSRITSKPILSFGYPVYKSDGTLSGVLGIGLDLDWLEVYSQVLPHPEHTFVTVVDDFGQIVQQDSNREFKIPDGVIKKIIADKTHTDTVTAGKITETVNDGSSQTYLYQSLSTEVDNPIHVIVAYNDQNLSFGIEQELKRTMLYLVFAVIISLSIATISYPYLVKRVKTLH